VDVGGRHHATGQHAGKMRTQRFDLVFVHPEKSQLSDFLYPITIHVKYMSGQVFNISMAEQKWRRASTPQCLF
jgi:hypothetical protein